MHRAHCTLHRSNLYHFASTSTFICEPLRQVDVVINERDPLSIALSDSLHPGGAERDSVAEHSGPMAPGDVRGAILGVPVHHDDAPGAKIPLHRLERPLQP